jgi:hypothetical protein
VSFDELISKIDQLINTFDEFDSCINVFFSQSCIDPLLKATTTATVTTTTSLSLQWISHLLSKLSTALSLQWVMAIPSTVTHQRGQTNEKIKPRRSATTYKLFE